MATEGGGRWLLLVEDNEDDERLAARAIKRAAVQAVVTVARDGEEAVHTLEAVSARLPVLVLLDIMLPKLSGLDVLRWMREREAYRAVPAVVMVGPLHSVDLASIYALGANSLVRKELDYELYMDRMVSTLRYWMDVNATPQGVVLL